MRFLFGIKIEIRPLKKALTEKGITGSNLSLQKVALEKKNFTAVSKETSFKGAVHNCVLCVSYVRLYLPCDELAA